MSCSSSIRIGFSAVELVSKSLEYEGERVYLSVVQRERLHPADLFTSKIQHGPDQTIDTRLCPYFVRLHLRAHRPLSPKSLPD